MNSQDLYNLQEAYLDVYSFGEGLGGAPDPERVQKRLDQIDADIERGREMYANGEMPWQKRKKADQAQEFLKKHPRKKRTHKEQVDLYDIILSHLLDEELLDEGLKKAFIQAYGRASRNASGSYSNKDDVERAERIRAEIERRYGPETLAHADTHAYVQRVGTRYGKPEPRIQRNRYFKPTAAGKMPKSAQTGFKNELLMRQSHRGNSTIGGVTKPKHWNKVGGEKGLPEQVDLYDIILSHLLDEGYADTFEAAEVMMVHMSEDWRESIVEEVLDEGAAGDVAARAATLARRRRQTPEMRAIYTKLAQKAATRERGPIPSVDRRKGLTSDERTQRRDDDAYHSDVNDGRSRPNQHGQPSYGPGGVTKNPRKLAQQKARGQHR